MSAKCKGWVGPGLVVCVNELELKLRCQTCDLNTWIRGVQCLILMSESIYRIIRLKTATGLFARVFSLTSWSTTS